VGLRICICLDEAADFINCPVDGTGLLPGHLNLVASDTITTFLSSVVTRLVLVRSSICDKVLTAFATVLHHVLSVFLVFHLITGTVSHLELK